MTGTPLQLFHEWIPDAYELALATATPDGRPSVRMVLLKSADERGFTFFTGYTSRKGLELEANPRAALLFHRPGIQVRIEGSVERIPEAESVAYILSAELGLDSSDYYTFGYVATWAGGGDEAIAGIRAAGERIQGAARRLLTALERA